MTDADITSQENVTPAVELEHPSSGLNELGNEKQDVLDNPNPELLQANPPIEATPSDPIEPDTGGDEESIESVVSHYTK